LVKIDANDIYSLDDKIDSIKKLLLPKNIDKIADKILSKLNYYVKLLWQVHTHVIVESQTIV